MAGLNVLIVDHEGALHGELAQQMRQTGCDVQVAASGNDAIRCVQSQSPDLVLLTHSSNDLDPFDLCRRIRQEHAPTETPLFLVAPGSGTGGIGAADGDSLSSHNATSGEAQLAADLTTLLQGLAAALNGGVPRSTLENRVSIGGLEIDRTRYRVWIDGRELHLTPTEFRLVWTLASEPGCVFTRQQLTHACIGKNSPVHERTIDVHVKAIRQKLEGRANLLETVRGVGYRFSQASSEPTASVL